jgi:hypothetical protein
MAGTTEAADDWRVKRGVLTAVATVALATAGAAADGARKSPATFRLVFDGKHTPALLHEGPFSTSASFCLSGYAADASIEAETETAVRTFRCSGAADEFTAPCEAGSR